jgi:hypothetical protein
MFLSVVLFGESLTSNLNQFVSNYFGRYEVYEGGGEIGTGLGLLYNSLFFFLVLFYAQSQNTEVSLLFKIAILSYFFLPMGLLIMMIGRVGMYFQPAVLAVFPIILLNIRSRAIRFLFITMVSAMTMYSFYGFFQSDVWSKPFGTYQTIFSAPIIY